MRQHIAQEGKMRISPRPLGPLHGKKPSPSHKQNLLVDLQKNIAEAADVEALKVILEVSTSEEVFQDEVDLVDWIPALNRIDDALECGIPRVSLIRVKEEEVKGLEQLEYSCWIGILEACLKFTRLLLSNSTGRRNYNSVDRLEALLFVREEFLADEALRCMYALAMPPYPHRRGCDTSPDFQALAPWLNNVKGRARKLLLLMTGWGGIAQGVGMLDCTTIDGTKTLLPEHAGDLIFECGQHLKITERALHRTGETSAEAFNRIVSNYDVPPDCQFALLVNIRLAVGFGSLETRRKVVERRLLALLTLSLADPTSPLLLCHFESYPDFVQELIDLVRVQFITCNLVPYALSSLAMRCLDIILYASGSHRGALKIVARNSNIFDVVGLVRPQYDGLVMCLVRYSVSELMSPSWKDENRGPLFYEWMESVLSLVHTVIDTDNSTESLVECGILGALFSLLKKWQIFQCKWSSENEWSDGTTAPPAPPRPLYWLVGHVISLVKLILMNDSVSFDDEWGEDGMGVLVSLLSAELQCLCHSSSSSYPSMPPSGDKKWSNNSSSHSCSLMEPSLAQRDFIHSVLSCLSKLVHHQSFAQSDGCKVLQGMEMTNALICLFDNIRTCGGAFAAFAAGIVSDIMNHDPLYVRHVQLSGIATSFICSLNSGLPPCAPLIMAIPKMLCALFLVPPEEPEDAEHSIGSSPPFSLGPETLHSFLRLFGEPEFVLPSSSCLGNCLPSIVGSGLEEFMRHVPKLKVGCISALVAVMKRVVSTAADQYLVQQYVTNLTRILEPLISKSCHLRSFVDECGLDVLSELFSISLLPNRSFLANISCKGLPTVTESSSRSIFQSPGYFLGIHSLGLVFKSVCAHDPSRLLEHLFNKLERSMEALSSSRSDGGTDSSDDMDHLAGILRCHSPDCCLSVPLHAVVPNPGYGGGEEGDNPPPLPVYLGSYATLLKELVLVHWLTQWINLALLRCIHQRRNSGIPFLNSPRGRRILGRLFNLHRSVVVELCHGHVVSREDETQQEDEEQRCRCPSIPVPSEMFIIRVVRPAGANIESRVSTYDSHEVCALDTGTILQAHQRFISDSGVTRYRTPYGWVSGYNRGGCKHLICEVIDLRRRSPNSEVHPVTAATSSNSGRDGLQQQQLETSPCDASWKRYPVATLREAGVFILRNLVDAVSDIVGALGKAHVIPSSSANYTKIAMQDRMDISRFAAVALKDFITLKIPPAPQSLPFLKSAIKFTVDMLFDSQCDVGVVNEKILWDLLTLDCGDHEEEQQHGKIGIFAPHSGKVHPMDMVFSTCISGVFHDLQGSIAAVSSCDESHGEGNMLSDLDSLHDGCKFVFMKDGVKRGEIEARVILHAALTLIRRFCIFKLVRNKGYSDVNALDYDLPTFRHYINIRLTDAVFEIWSDPNLGLRPKEFLDPFLSCVHCIINSLCSTRNKSQDRMSTRAVAGRRGSSPSDSLFLDLGTALNEPETEGQQRLLREPSETTLLAAMECGFTRDHILQGYQSIQSEQIEVLMDWLLSHPMNSSSEGNGEEDGASVAATAASTTASDSAAGAVLSCTEKNKVEDEKQCIKDIGQQWLELSNEKLDAFLLSFPEVYIRLVGKGGPGITHGRNSYAAYFVKDILSLQHSHHSGAENQDDTMKDFISDLVKISTDELDHLSSFDGGLESHGNSSNSSHADKVANHLHLLLLLVNDANSKYQLQLRKMNLHITLLRSIHNTVQQLQQSGGDGGSDGSSSWPSHIVVCLLLLVNMVSFLVVNDELEAMSTVATQSYSSLPPDVNNSSPESPSAPASPDPLLSIIPMVTTLLVEDFAIDLTVELGGIFVLMHAGSIPPAPSSVMQAMFQLLYSLLQYPNCVPALREKLGDKGVNVFLYLPSSCSFKGHVSLIASILRGLLEDNSMSNRKAVMESKIRSKFSMLSRMPNSSNGVRYGELRESVRFSDLLNILGPLIAQDRMTFVSALRSQLQVLNKNQPPTRIFVVLQQQQENCNGHEEGGGGLPHSSCSSTTLKDILFSLTSYLLNQKMHMAPDCTNNVQEAPPPSDDDHFISSVDIALLLSEMMSVGDPVCSTVINDMYCGIGSGHELSEEARKTLRSINHYIPGSIPPDPSVVTFILHKLISSPHSEEDAYHVVSSSRKKQLQRMRFDSVQAGIILILNLVKGPGNVCRCVCNELLKAIRCQGLDCVAELNDSALLSLANWSELAVILMVFGEHLYLNKFQGHQEEEENPVYYLVNGGLFSALFNAFSRLNLQKTTVHAAIATLLHSMQYVLRMQHWKVLDHHCHMHQIKKEETTGAEVLGNSESSDTLSRRRRNIEERLLRSNNISIVPVGGAPFTVQLIDDSHGSSDFASLPSLSNDALEAAALMNGGIVSLDIGQGIRVGGTRSFVNGDRMRIGGRANAQEVNDDEQDEDDITSGEESGDAWDATMNLQRMDDISVDRDISSGSTATTVTIPSLFYIVRTRNLLNDTRLGFDDPRTRGGSGLLMQQHEDTQSPFILCSELLGFSNLCLSGVQRGHSSSSPYPIPPFFHFEPSIHPLLQHNEQYHNWQRGHRQRRGSQADLGGLRIQALLGDTINETSLFGGLGTQSVLTWPPRGIFDTPPASDRVVTTNGLPPPSSCNRNDVPFHLRHCGFNVPASVGADVAKQLYIHDGGGVQPTNTEPAAGLTGNQTDEFGDSENGVRRTSLHLYPARDASPAVSSTMAPPPPDSQHSDDDPSSSACSSIAEDDEAEDVDGEGDEEEEQSSNSEEELENNDEMDIISTNNVRCSPLMDQVYDAGFHSLQSSEIQQSAEPLHDCGGLNAAAVVDQAADAGATADCIEANGLDPEVLAALPTEIQEEILENQSWRIREEEQQLDPSLAEDIDNASFVVSLTPDLRREVLSTADDVFLRTLPPNLVAEAMLLRERGPRAMDEDEDSGTGEEMHLERTNDDLVVSGNAPQRGSGGATAANANPNSMTLPPFWMKYSDDEVPLTVDAWITFVKFLCLRTPIKRQKDLLCTYQHLCEMHENVMHTVVHSLIALLAGDQIAVLTAMKKFLPHARNDGVGSGCEDSSHSFSSDEEVLQDELSEEGGSPHHHSNEQKQQRQVLLPRYRLIGPSGNGSPREDVESIVVQRVMKALQYLIQSSPRVCHELLNAQMLPFRRKRKRAGNGEPSDCHPPLQILDYLLSQVDRPLFSASLPNMKQLLHMLGWLVKPLCELDDIRDNHSKPPTAAQTASAEKETMMMTCDVAASRPEEVTDCGSSISSTSSFMDHVPMPRPIVSSECLRKLCGVFLLTAYDNIIVERLRRILKSLCKVRENRIILIDEMGSIAAQLGRALSKHLCKIVSELHQTSTASSSGDACSASRLVDVQQGTYMGVQFLCVLDTLRWLIGPDADGVLSSWNFDDVWSSLNQCLEALRPFEKINIMPKDDAAAHLLCHKKKGSSSSHRSSSTTDMSSTGLGAFGTVIAWGLLPTIEAFFVANKHFSMVKDTTSHSKLNDDIPAENAAAAHSPREINMSSLQLQRAPKRTTEELPAAMPNPPQNCLVAFAAANCDLINSLVRSYPRLMDLVLEPMASDPACQRYLDFGNKLTVFRSRMKAIREQSSCRLLHFDVPRDKVFEHSFHQTCVRSPNEMLGKLHVRFQGEEGVDAGGLTREWFSILAKEIFNENYALFIAASDGTTFQPNPLSRVNPEHLKYFKFVGRITGKAIADGELFPAPYTCSFYKVCGG